MMKLIKGRKYNTDTAKLIGVVGEQQKLYSKRTGEFFLYFVDKKIVPLSFDKAEKIVKEKLDKKTYDNLFNKNGIEKVTLLLDSKIVQDARNEAVARNIRLNTLVEEAICEYLNLKNVWQKTNSTQKVEFLFWIRLEYVCRQTTENYRKLKNVFCVKMLVTESLGKAQKIAHLKLKVSILVFDSTDAVDARIFKLNNFVIIVNNRYT